MRDLIEIIIGTATMCAVVVVTVLGLFAGVEYLSSVVETNAMTSLGYDAKLAGFSCYVKYEGGYLPCSTVMSKQLDKHQIELTTKETK